ncbi:Ribonuclease II/R family protein [Klebsormidium nitens]|uniref:Ribonuclease II/R family protein n=1 Tax=Klebsormidium nitens TaxID=105231 RepID=A0A1Y1I3C2_KLENI|nr:Ribonuclease II/R family protein [Klebsormidium nitens]|eukprot:GAQ85435.1 Ribonuclease II/R family protein [Klebsormidium nitens]
MYQQKQFFKKTRGGKILKVHREHYLRDDIVCGSLACTTCAHGDSTVLSSEAAQYLLIDTNVALHQMDLLENAAIADVIVPEVVLSEVQARNKAIHGRLRLLVADKSRRFFVFSNEHHKDTFVKTEKGEIVNDRNDRAIRRATTWYQSHLAGKTPDVLLLTNDADNARRARDEGAAAQTVYAYVQSRTDKPELLDFVARTGDTGGEAAGPSAEGDAGPQAKRRMLYAEHKGMAELTAGLQKGLFHQGKLRVNRFNCFEAYVGSQSVGKEILIQGREDLNRAVDGDVVAVELLPPEQWKGPEGGIFREHDEEEEGVAENAEEGAGLAPEIAEDAPGAALENLDIGKEGGRVPTGRVVGIIKRNWRNYAGSLEPMKGPGGSGAMAHPLFVSVDRRVPKIRIQTRQLANLADKRIIVAIDKWDRTSRYPEGHYIKTLGDIGDRATESELLLMENDINTRPFSQAVLNCLPPLPWSVSDADVAKPWRADLRNLRVCSVDPIGCRDIDDALHCTALPNGNFEIGVHIADVTNFVHPETPLDLEAADRGTSVYLVERRIDMLPKPLTEDICSLRADVDRLAFSVIWEMTPSADIVKSHYTKSIIRSSAALSYPEAQARMDDPHMSDPLTEDLRNLNRLAKIMRQRRTERGALTLASPEVKFEIDTETHNPLDVGMYQIREANQMIEEYMLLANVSVAEKILKHFPSCSLLRRHPVPTPQMFEPLLRTAAAVGIELDVGSSKALADSLDRAQGSDPYFNKLIRILATRCMTQAVYFCSGELSPPEYHHYGLASPLYTHFTSPIRRYADVVVHRLLAAALNLTPLPERTRDKKSMHDLSDGLNYRHRNAQMAGRASVELHTLIFFKDRAVDAEARIVKVRSNGFIVFVPKYGIEGPVYLTKKPDKGAGPDPNDDFVVDEEHQTITSKDKRQTYKVLDTVTVHIEVQEPQPHRPKLILTLASDSKEQDGFA